MDCYPQHTHSISTAYPQGRFSGCVSGNMGLLRNRSHKHKKNRRVESAGLSSDRGVNFGPATIDERLFRGP
jgi:hypothetical protein